MIITAIAVAVAVSWPPLRPVGRMRMRSASSISQSVREQYALTSAFQGLSDCRCQADLVR